MPSSKNFIAVPPGETIREQLQERGLKQKDFAVRMDMSEKHISRLINGEVELTYDVALRLEYVLGIEAKFWNSLEASYREKLLRVKAEEEMLEEIDIVKKFQYSKMAARGWVKVTKAAYEQVCELRAFFETARLQSLWKFTIPGIAYRKLGESDTSDYAVAAWAQKVRLESRNICVSPVDLKRLAKMLPDIRSLTRENFTSAFGKLRAFLADCGIALVCLEPLKSSFLGGASFFDGKKIVLGLTLRGKKADSFWFTLFHELAHIILSDITASGDWNADDDKERRADQWARENLIPEDRYVAFVKNGLFDRQSICDFAQKMQIGACIVVGRLQKDKRLAYSALNDLRPSISYADCA